MKELSEKHVSELKKKTFVELSALAAYEGEKTAINGKTCSVAIWKDVIGDNELRIVVQVYRHWFLGIGRMYACGFKIRTDGKTSDLTKEELYEFM